MDAPIERYNIQDPARIFNVDESEIGFESLCRRSLKKEFGRSSKHLYHLETTSKRNLDRVTIMGVAIAAVKAYSLAVVFPGEQARYQYVNGNVQAFHTYLPACCI